MVRPPHEIDTINEAFAPHPYVIVAPPGHALADQRQIPFSRLTQEPFISRERGSDTWNSLQDAFGERTQQLKITMEIASTETIKQAVVAGMGISFLSAHTVGMELRTGQLTVLDVEGFPAWQSWYVVHRRSKRLPPVALAFRQFLLDEGAMLIDGMMAYKSPVPPPVANAVDIDGEHGDRSHR